MKKLLILLALLVMSGCSGPWLKTEGAFTSPVQNFSVDLPHGWMRSNQDDRLLITRDGLGLQYIVIWSFDITKEGQHFLHTKKRLTGGMLPHEIAEVIIDDRQSNPDYSFQEVEDNSPASVGGKDGYRLQFLYRTKSGLRYRYLGYGFLFNNKLYQFVYIAPVRYYFDKDRATFERVVQSFRLTMQGT